MKTCGSMEKEHLRVPKLMGPLLASGMRGLLGPSDYILLNRNCWPSNSAQLRVRRYGDISGFCVVSCFSSEVT